jgi:hypothetical protein
VKPRPASFWELALALGVIILLGVIAWGLSRDKNIMDD